MRITASDATRKARGYVYTPAVDDSPSERDLDGVPVDITVPNDSATGHHPAMEVELQKVFEVCIDAYKTAERRREAESKTA